MTLKEITAYKNRPCRFRLRSGKEVYGVIWEDESASRPTLYFSSKGEMKLYERAKAMYGEKALDRLRHSIDIGEIVSAELI